MRRYPILLSDLTNIIQTEMGKLDKATNSAPFMRLKGKIEELKADPRYNFMFSGMLVGDTMADFVGKIFRLPSGGKPISIIDVSGVPSDITSTVVAVLSRLVFDYAIWSRNEPQRPILLVCEEAHRYIPSDRVSKASAVRSILERIAKEGRKYGVSLGPDHTASVRSGRRRAVAVRHDHLDAFEQRPRPGLCPRRHARRRARLSRFHSSACATASASSAERVSASPSASRSTTWKKKNARRRKTRCSASYGRKPAAKQRYWSGW